MEGIVFDIKEFSVHDGPGVRTTVFFKGCPLSCRWCHNPEGLSPHPELTVRTARCRQCGLCRRPCHHEECAPYGRCLKVCPDGLVSVTGKRWSAEALAGKLAKNADFFASCGGGITVSGGEPTLQADFLFELLDRLNGIHRTVETCGYTTEARFRSLLARTELIMMDIKLADPGEHRHWCGVDNGPILSNFRILKESGHRHLIRIPLIPGVTDTEKNLRAISAIVGDSPVELLPYNSFAGAKYESVGRVFTMPETTPNPVDVSLFANASIR